MNRDCPVCDGAGRRQVYRQQFGTSSSDFVLRGYDVVVCETCGMAFADDIPDQAALDAYYKGMSKYEEHNQGGETLRALDAMHERVARGIAPFIPGPDSRIIDIGCATGGVLAHLKRQGFPNVVGLDPSPACARIALQRYGVRVLPRTISEIRSGDEPYDVLLLCSVVEHIRDLKGSIRAMGSILKDRGVLYAEGPDVTAFTRCKAAPFQQFSMEHINFFSRYSLANLFQSEGFELIDTWQDERVVGAMQDMALCAAFRKSAAARPVPMKFDTVTGPALEEYVRQSRQTDQFLRQKIDAATAGGRPIIVWGAGTHTMRLLTASNLGKANVIAFVDSNARYHGKSLNGVPILAPNDLRARREPILISSQTYEQEIEQQIRNELGLTNEVVRLYSEPSEPHE